MARVYEAIEVDPNGPWFEGKYLVCRLPADFEAKVDDLVIGYQPTDSNGGIARLYRLHGLSADNQRAYLDMASVDD